MELKEHWIEFLSLPTLLQESVTWSWKITKDGRTSESILFESRIRYMELKDVMDSLVSTLLPRTLAGRIRYMELKVGQLPHDVLWYLRNPLHGVERGAGGNYTLFVLDLGIRYMELKVVATPITATDYLNVNPLHGVERSTRRRRATSWKPYSRIRYMELKVWGGGMVAPIKVSERNPLHGVERGV